MNAFKIHDRAKIVSSDSNFINRENLIGEQVIIVGLPDECKDAGGRILYRVACKGLEFWTPWDTLKA